MAYRTLNHIRQADAEEDDIFNKNNTHSYEKDCLWDYNCMSYAFKIFGWFLPVGSAGYDNRFNDIDWEIWVNHYGYDYDDDPSIVDEIVEDIEDVMEELEIPFTDERYEQIANEVFDALWCADYDNEWLMQLAEKRMLKSFKGLRKINSFNELEDGEYGIVYACGGGDFHFLRYEDGVYTHKQGGGDIKTAKNENDGFGYRYNSRRIYFAMKNSEVGNYSY